MSFKDKIQKATPSDWLTKDIPKWQVWMIVRWARFKARIKMRWKK